MKCNATQNIFGFPIQRILCDEYSHIPKTGSFRLDNDCLRDKVGCVHHHEVNSNQEAQQWAAENYPKFFIFASSAMIDTLCSRFKISGLEAVEIVNKLRPGIKKYSQLVTGKE